MSKASKRFFFPVPGEATWEEERRALHLLVRLPPADALPRAKDLGRNGQQDTILRACGSVRPPSARLGTGGGESACLTAGEAVRMTTAPQLSLPTTPAASPRRRTSDFFIHREPERHSSHGNWSTISNQKS